MWLKSFAPILAAGICLTIAGSGDTGAGEPNAPASPRTSGAPLSVLQVSPSFGPASGGYSTVIMGSGFGPGTKVRIGNVYSSEVVVVNSTLMNCRMMPAVPGETTITVIDAAGRTASGKFLYTDPLPVAGDVEITAPADGAAVRAGSTITVSARATGGFGIASVLLVSKAFTNTYHQASGDSFSASVTLPADRLGPLEIALFAKDAKSNLKSAKSVTVTVVAR